MRPSRLLFVSRTFPADFERATYGIYIRMRMLLECVRPLADELEIVYFVDPEIPVSERLRLQTERNLDRYWRISARVTLVAERAVDGGADAWSHYIRPALSVYRNPDFAGTAGPDQVRAVVDRNGPDVIGVVAHRLGAMWPVVLGTGSWPPVFLDLDDIEHRKLVRALRARPFYPGKLGVYLRVPALLAGELRAVRRARATFVCSDGDRAYLARMAGGAAVHTLPNAIALPARAPPDPGTETLLFIGSYTYEPNVDAAEDLVRSLWPRIRARRPHARLLIAGQRPERIPSFASAPAGVTFTGFVPDVADLYAQARVVCCPIRAGGGTRIKIIEATGYGRPVVSTPVGAEGLEFAAPAEIRIAATNDAFVDACAELLGDPAAAQTLGTAARRRARQAYDRGEAIARARAIIASGLPTAAGAEPET